MRDYFDENYWDCEYQYDQVIMGGLSCCDEYSCPFLYWLDKFTIHLQKQGVNIK